MTESDVLDPKHEYEVNIVYLLLSRYNGDIARVAKIFGQTNKNVRAWLKQHREEVSQIFEKEKKGTTGRDEETPSIDKLKRMALQRLGATIPSESDPSRVARTLEVLMKTTPSNSGKATKSMSQAIIDGINAKNKDNEEQQN